ncbi:amidohydrolase family protein [Xanthovirga aplysinae]|uniref:amidohydrolase family protein n=1 Tax=Xanthovirga aplysinae TaxID=2529853 RepID=UPI0012BD4B86|nr:amidohydrolase family protein [Xanthovirga aplysinae]MTI31887.1 amidohydrolase [Xanthovirga aplysinae]
MKKFYSLFLALCIVLTTNGQDSNDNWDVTQPDKPFKEITIETDEGTWMNLDVSPDGKQIVFDLLGDIYLMPITGGEAILLRSGHAYEVQPRFSPDGKKIAFTSDAGGGDNIWIMNNDGSQAHQVSKEDFRLLNNPVWTPDGQYLIARKHFTSERSLGAGEIWMYHISGGKGIQLTKRKNDQQDVNEPWVSPDGRYVYFSEDMYPGGYFQYNKDPNSQIYIIRRYDREKGETKNFISGPGGAVRPQASPDGKKLAFIRRVRTKSVLFIQDLETGIQRPVYEELSKDQQEAWAIFGVYPGFNWMPDNKNVVIWAKGKIRKINTENGSAQIIPFKTKAKHQIVDALQFKNNPDPDTFEAHVIRHAVTSPDGKWLVFNAAGKLWKKQLPNGKPQRLTTFTDFEFEPNFSPDGKQIVFVSWNDENRGAIWRIPLKGGKAIKLTKEKGIFREPAFSPNGNHIVYRKERGGLTFGQAYSVDPGIYWMNIQDKKPQFITSEGTNPKFNAKGDRIYYQTGGSIFGELDKNFKSIDLSGEDEKTHFHSKYANQYTLSPNHQWLAFSELHQVYIMPFAESGKSFELSADTEALPLAKVSDDAGINLQWSSDNKSLHYTLGNTLYSVALKDAFTFVEGAADSIPEIKKDSLHINLTLNSDRPKGLIAFNGAKLITMNGEKVIEKGVILIKDNKILDIGPANQVTIPEDAKIIDVEGKTIMPGIIDTHAHLNAFRTGLSPQKDWPYYANLAFGITATHDPSSNSEMALSQSEMVKTGNMVGPRIFSTGTILYGADGDFKAPIKNLDDARSTIRRTKAFGVFSVKSYNQPRREQRQQIIKAAREEGIMVYPEGGSTFFHNMTMILDGHTSIEHNVPVAPLYKDVVSLWSASKTANTPTLIVNYAGLSGEYYWYQKTNVWENEKLLKYTPRAVIDARSRHRTKAPEEEYENGHILTSRSLKKLVDNGVKVCVGGHGQLQGLGVHWEMWMLQQGGMTNMEVLRAATLHGAEYIGMGDHLGSLEVGKLADLIVLDKDPLNNIQNTNSVALTMVNGRLYETETMNEIGNYNRPRTKFFWELDGYNSNFDFHAETQSFMLPHCVCEMN